MQDRIGFPRGVAAFCAVLFCNGVAPVAVAEETGVVDVDEHTLADHDGNGCVDSEELRNLSMRVFRALDLNHDGVVAGDEHLEAVRMNGEPVTPEAVDVFRFQQEMSRSMQLADTNGDGCLDKEEWGGK